jgi:hypothetical protein
VHGGNGKNFQVDTHGDDIPIRWACWSRQCHDKFKPSLLGLVRGVLSFQAGKDVAIWNAVKYLNRFLGDTPLVESKTGCRPKPKAQQTNLFSFTREQVRRTLQIPSPYFLSRGFSPEVLDKMDVGHSVKQGRSIIPLYDDDGKNCIGYTARSELPACGACGHHHPQDGRCRYVEPKWTFPNKFEKGSHLYNYHTARRSQSPIMLLTEGPGDVWKAEEAGYLAVAMLGLTISHHQLAKLAALNKHIFLALDNDQPGRKALSSVNERLGRRVTYVSPLFIPPAYKDLGEMPVEKMRGWLSECISPGYRPQDV